MKVQIVQLESVHEQYLQSGEKLVYTATAWNLLYTLAYSSMTTVHARVIYCVLSVPRPHPIRGKRLMSGLFDSACHVT